MIRISKIITARGQGAYYCEDVLALVDEPCAESERWQLSAVSAGFHYAREVAETVSVGLQLESGEVAWGDCVGVSYAGKSGREPVLRAAELEARIRDAYAPALRGVSFSSFLNSAEFCSDATLPASWRYGLSQAFLQAVALRAGVTPTEILCAELGVPLSSQPVRLHGSCGNDRRGGADKMIMNRLSVLPHTQVENVSSQFGQHGEVLLDYADWLCRRIETLGSRDYRPALHFDLHGALGKVFKNAEEPAIAFLKKLKAICGEHEVRVESPYLEASRDQQVARLGQLRRSLREQGVAVLVAVDEWASSVEDITAFLDAQAVDWVHIKMPTLGSLHASLAAVAMCKSRDVKALLGGSCIETDLSSMLSVHVALAARADALLVKPGMGINEGLSIMRNEMARTLAEIQIRSSGASG